MSRIEVNDLVKMRCLGNNHDCHLCGQYGIITQAAEDRVGVDFLNKYIGMYQDLLEKVGHFYLN